MATMLLPPATFAAADRADAEATFLSANPAFRRTALLDELRATEYRRLDERGEIYLDYTGGSLYAESQLEERQGMMRDAVYGNPHSISRTSSAATILLERTRAAQHGRRRSGLDAMAAVAHGARPDGARSRRRPARRGAGRGVR